MRLLMVLLLLVPVTGFSQLIKDSYGSSGNVVGEVKEKTRLVSKLTWEMSGTDTLYIFTFANAKGATFSDHQAIVFSGAKMLNNFYIALKSAFADKNYNVKWTEGGLDITISRGEPKGTVMISVENGHCYLTEKQLDKTFGK
jgi:hypothetical protein